ncbi:MAG TPA: hypothetical protein VFB45_15490 [Pseudolabrys sp.]|nr:hypothetical protein [Pseudolabrys sp.]
MSNVGDLVERLVEVGLSIAEASEIIAAAVAAGAATAAYRKSPGAIRTARWRGRHKASQSDGQVTQNPIVTERHKASQSVTCDAHNIEESKKEKKVKVSIETPDRPTEKAMNFAAIEHRWELTRIQTEWQRFRDHGIAKGRRHRGFVGLEAAWRNWVTSPYQQTGASNGQRTHAAPSPRRSGADDFFAGLSSVAQDLCGDSAVAGPADADIPRGRIEIDG